MGDKWFTGVVPTNALDNQTTPNEIVIMQQMLAAEEAATSVQIPFSFAALTALQPIKAGPGVLTMVDGFNPGASTIFLQIFDALAANVVLGTTIPKQVIVCPAGLNGGFVLPIGMQFSVGITIAATTTPNGSTLLSGANAPTVSYTYN